MSGEFYHNGARGGGFALAEKFPLPILRKRGFDRMLVAVGGASERAFHARENEHVSLPNALSPAVISI